MRGIGESASAVLGGNESPVVSREWTFLPIFTNTKPKGGALIDAECGECGRQVLAGAAPCRSLLWPVGQ